jgi:citronellol/citronellal dehydrogenase
MAKYGMSMCVLGMAEEFREAGVAFNALWPRTVIDTAAITILGDAVKPENCRSPEIMADAAHIILCQSARQCTGHFYLDEDVLRASGERSFDKYAVRPGAPLLRDLFLDK